LEKQSRGHFRTKDIWRGRRISGTCRLTQGGPRKLSLEARWEYKLQFWHLFDDLGFNEVVFFGVGSDGGRVVLVLGLEVVGVAKISVKQW
jgi:hypothetical protein